MDSFQIDKIFAESFWSIPIIFHLFGAALILLHPETRILIRIFFGQAFILVLTMIILIEQLTNSITVEAIKRSSYTSDIKFKTSNDTTNNSIIKQRRVAIPNIGDPLQWDELLIAMLLFVIALILFITGMYMVDQVQHGKDRSIQKYIHERKRSRKKEQKMESVLNELINSSYNDAIMASTSIDSQ
ncbi:putative apyrase [Dirofilaria immitis]